MLSSLILILIVALGDYYMPSLRKNGYLGLIIDYLSTNLSDKMIVR